MPDDRPTFGSLFAGIGGIDLGLERAGWECRFQVEWDPFCQRVLAKHWPDVPRFGDIHDVHGPGAHLLADASGERRRQDARGASGDEGSDEGWPAQDDHVVDGGGEGQRCPDCLPEVDLLAGGFPCQPFSVAGRQRGMDDDRWLWPEFARTIRELRPRYVFVENVPGLLVGGGMGAVLGDLASLGYDAEWESIPAAAVGAPHLRYRVWIIGSRRDVAHANGDGPRWEAALGPSSESGLRPSEAGAEPDGASDGPLADADGTGLAIRQGSANGRGTVRHQGDAAAARGVASMADSDDERWLGRAGELGPGWGREPADGGWWRVEPDVGRVAHGVPARVDRLRSLGNAVVPQVVEWIGQRLYEEAVA